MSGGTVGVFPRFLWGKQGLHFLARWVLKSLSSRPVEKKVRVISAMRYIIIYGRVQLMKYGADIEKLKINYQLGI